MALTGLPKELIIEILSHVAPRDVAAVASTCSYLRGLTLLDVLWERIALRRHGVDLAQKANRTRGKSARSFYASVLHPFAPALGLWQRRDVEHYGSVHQLVYLDFALHLIQWYPPISPDVFAPLRMRTFLTIREDEASGEAVLKHADDVVGLDGADFDVKVARGDILELHVEGAKDFAADPDLWRGEMTRFFELWTGKPVNADEDNPEAYVQTRMLLMKFMSIYESRKALSFGRFNYFAPLDHKHKLPIRQGLFKGTYSAHGLEIVDLQYLEEEGEGLKFVGVKITGDSNVPFNEIVQELLSSTGLRD